MSEAMTVTHESEWRPAGARKLRLRTETNRIISLSDDALDVSGLEEGTEVSLYARGGEILATRWRAGIPELVALPSHESDKPEVGEGNYLPAGVMEVHYSGDSLVVTLPNRALAVAGFEAGHQLQLWSHEGALKLTAEGPDVEGDA